MNVLLVDDMKSVINGMIKGIDWERLKITGIYKAYNVYEAKVLLSNLQIDILMTDVEMPGESGLDLVTWVREQGLEIECIILSSHANFDYARRAVAVQSFQYVLLPCPYEEITEILEKVTDKLRKRQEQNKIYKYGMMLSDSYWFDSLLFGLCLEEDANREAARKLQEIYDTDQGKGGWLCMFTITKMPEQVAECEDSLMDFILRNVISELMGLLQYRIFMSRRSDKRYVVFALDIYGQAVDADQFWNRLAQVGERMEKTLHIVLSFCFEYCGGFSEISRTYIHLKEKNVCIEGTAEGQNPMLDKEGELLETISKYVHTHIGQDIKRNDIAELVHLNLDYLARVFKRNTGVTLNDYIVNEKMRVANNLLKTTRLPVSLIATRVGYSNFSYFSKLYRKTYGKSPGEERL